jgi:hypothetical protein
MSPSSADDFVTVGGPVGRTRATLRLDGDALDPASVTNALGARPTFAVRKGEVWRTAKGAELTARTGIWRRRTDEATPGDLEAQISKLLGELTDDLETWRDLTARYDANVFCGLFLDRWNQGLSLDPKTLLMLGSRGIRLDLDIYGETGTIDAPDVTA